MAYVFGGKTGYSGVDNEFQDKSLQADMQASTDVLHSGMINGEQFAQMALSFAGAEQVLHFDRIGFKVTGRRMFATYLGKDNTANIFLTAREQAVFCKMAKNIYPVSNKWGEKGATTFELNSVPKHIVLEALLSAYNELLNPRAKKD